MAANSQIYGLLLEDQMPPAVCHHEDRTGSWRRGATAAIENSKLPPRIFCMKVDDRIGYNPRHSGREGFDRIEPKTVEAVEEETSTANRHGLMPSQCFRHLFSSWETRQ
jgi:hypothetical protein